MKHLATIRIFSDSYQFWVYESDKEPFEPLPEYTDESITRGWQRTEHSISFTTRAHLNDHRLDIYLSEQEPVVENAERITAHPISVVSGITIYDNQDSFNKVLTPGDYTLVLAAYNLGKEQDYNEDELDDEKFFERVDWERYELFICSIKTSKDMILK